MAGGNEVLDWLGGQHDAMVDLLGRLVNTDSGSYNKAGVDRVGEIIREFLSGFGITCEIIPQERFGDSIRARIGPIGNTAPILLLGHRDTVFPDGEAARRPFRVEGGKAYGPGVADMKAGLVMNSFVMAAFARAGAPIPMIALYTSDEEIASPASRPVIEAEARGVRAVFNAEPGRLNNNVVTGRKGGVFMKLTVRGKAAHSGVNFQDGISAIEELARKTTALHALTDLSIGTTVNVGLISGGQSVNTVAAEASAEIDLRYVEPPQREAALSAIQAIVNRSFVPGASAELTIAGEFVPLVQTPASEAMFNAYVAASAELGQTVDGEFAGGCADSGFTSALGTPTVCSTGPCGAKVHSPDEFLLVDTLVPRAQALALTIQQLEPA
ncbi:peptidase M20 [Agaricicola taiwanensis]|uniref:Peptidase M20 n=1 Tax=Agaricicola taiwanensis TaxID=591372 RepID=A0A8J2YG13_9RHOB|nr:M20 family metallopeptidase [Agaricicola taiwanensis]GGE31834.1 peptidase M20 [Agaricicola taiwanensis]